LVFFFLSFRFGENGKAWEKKGKKKKTKNENQPWKKKSLSRAVARDNFLMNGFS